MTFPPKKKRSPAEGELPLEYDWQPADEVLTAYAGIPLFVRTARSLDVPGSIQRHLHLKQRQRGLDEASYVESFLVLNALGGECLDDFARLREDAGLAEMLGHELPSPEAARKFLYGTFAHRISRSACRLLLYIDVRPTTCGEKSRMESAKTST